MARHCRAGAGTVRLGSPGASDAGAVIGTAAPRAIRRASVRRKVCMAFRFFKRVG